MAGTVDVNFESNSHVAAALLEAGQRYATAPLCQRGVSHLNSVTTETELRHRLYVAPGTTGGFSWTSKDAGIASFVKARWQNAAKVWVTVAACILLFFVALGVVWRITGGFFLSDPPSPKKYKAEDRIKLITGKTDTNRVPTNHSSLHAALAPRHQIHQHERQYAADEYEQFEGEDEQNQHPDDPTFVDVWDGEDAEHLNLSRGLEGLKTPLYRLPFAAGQHNGTHAIGVHSQALAVPRYLLVIGGRDMDAAIGGSYTLLMTPDGRPKPLLVHGRPIWRRTGIGLTGSTDSSPYLFYDHTRHTWVFNNILDFQNPLPLAFLPHGALLPVIKTQGNRRKRIGSGDNEGDRAKLTRYIHHGVPAGVHWIVREAHNGVSLIADETIRVTGDPAHNRSQDFYTLSVQKVFYAREDAGLHDDEEDDISDEGPEEANFADDEDDEELGISGGHLSAKFQDILSPFEDKINILSLPASTRTRQHFLTHPQTLVYHTFEKVHSHYPHASIVQDPVNFLEKNSHPDIQTVERYFGDDSTTVPHSLRQQ